VRRRGLGATPILVRSHAVLITLPSALAGSVPGLRNIAGSLSLITGAVYSLATAATLWPRDERLAARWPLIVLSAVHAAALFIGTYSTFSGLAGQDVVPSITSLFGFIYFESIIFALGASVFILALIKERNEAAGIGSRLSTTDMAMRLAAR
jgi:hypothetical protein